MYQIQLFTEPLPQEPNKVVVDTPERFERLANFLNTRKAISIDYETSGLAWFKNAHAIGMGLGAWDDQGRLWNAYVPFRHRTTDRQLDLRSIGPAIQRWLGDPSVLKIGHNIKFEDHFSRREGWTIAGPRYDTMIAGRLYNENYPAELEFRAERDLGIKDARRWQSRVHASLADLVSQNRMKKKEYLNQFGYSEIPVPICGPYCCTDTDHAGMLYQFYESKGLSSRYSRIWATEMELTRILCDMEENGLPVNEAYLRNVKAQVSVAKNQLEGEIQHALGGHMVNPGSDDEVRNLLYNVLGLRWTKETDSGQLAVDHDVLESFAETNRVCHLMLQWRDAEKISSTYTDSILRQCDSRGLLHCDFKSVGTNTGRLSCEKPNFHNFSNDDELRALIYSGKKLEDGGIDPWSVRRAFEMRAPGWARLLLDYSQIELRALAFYSKDPIMVQAYLNDEDIHERTRKEVSAILGRETERRIAKIVNFGLSYGLSEEGLSRQAKIPLEEAQVFMDAFFKRYVGITKFRLELCAQARRQRNQWTNIFGRTRRIPDLQAPEFWKQRSGERRMIGSAIQGTAAELTKESLVRIDRRLKQLGIPILLTNTVHDEIQIDTPKEYLRVVINECKPLMEDYPEFLPIPIKASVDWADTNWAEKRKWKNE